MDASDPPEPPPSDTHDSSEPPADVPDYPEPPKKTGGAVKKRERSLSYKTKKGSNNQKTSRADHPIVDVDSSIPMGDWAGKCNNQPLRPRFNSTGLVIEVMGGGGNVTIIGVELIGCG
jgi:hypothetical protein